MDEEIVNVDELKAKFIELDKKKAEYKKFLDDYKEVVAELVDVLGVGAHFQDSDGTVYQIDVPEGRYVYFEQYTVNRTRRDGERSGSLSMKKAKELGYNI